MSESVLHEIETVFKRLSATTHDEGDVQPTHRINSSDYRSEGKPAINAKRRSQRRFEEFNSFVDVTMGDLQRSELLVWLVLFRDARDGVARTSRVDVARRARVSEKSVTRAIAKLIERGLVRLVYRGGINRGISRYAILPTSTRDIIVSR